MIVIPSALLAGHPWLLHLAVALTGALGWTSILITALIGGGLAGTASGIKTAVSGDKFNAGHFFRDIGIGFGTAGVTAGLGAAITAALTPAQAAASTGANVAAAPVAEVSAPAVGATGVEGTSELVTDIGGEVARWSPSKIAQTLAEQGYNQAGIQGVQQAAAQAPAGTYGATGTAVANGAVSPAGASGYLSGATSSADLTRSIANMAPDALRQAGAPQAQQILQQSGQALATAGPKIAAAGLPGPSYPAFQVATEIARGGAPSLSDMGVQQVTRALATPAMTTGQRVASQALTGAISGGVQGYAQNPTDWRGPVYGALAGGASGGLGTGTSTALAPTFGTLGANIIGRGVGNTIGGGLRGLGQDDPGNAALAGAASGAAGSLIGGGLSSGWRAINPAAPLLPLKQVDDWPGTPMARNNDPYQDFARTIGSPRNAFSSSFDVRQAGPGDAEYARALGVSGMKAAETQFTGAAAGYGASAVQQAIRRPTQIIPPLLPTSGPAMYGAMRAQSGAMPIIGPGSQRRYY